MKLDDELIVYDKKYYIITDVNQIFILYYNINSQIRWTVSFDV